VCAEEGATISVRGNVTVNGEGAIGLVTYDEGSTAEVSGNVTVSENGVCGMAAVDFAAPPSAAV
jgi:hypothetical protein